MVASILDEVAWGESQEPEIFEQYRANFDENLVAIHMPPFCPLDYMVFIKEGYCFVPDHFLEIKARRISWHEHETTVIPLVKIKAAQTIFERRRILSYAVISYTDGLWCWDITKQPAGTCRIRRNDRESSTEHGEYRFEDGVQLR